MYLFLIRQFVWQYQSAKAFSTCIYPFSIGQFVQQYKGNNCESVFNFAICSVSTLLRPLLCLKFGRVTNATWTLVYLNRSVFAIAKEASATAHPFRHGLLKLFEFGLLWQELRSKKRTDSQRWWKTMKGIERKCSKICKTNTAALATCCPTMSCVRCPCASSCSFSFSSCWSLRSNSFRTCWLQNLGQREVKQNPLGLWISARFMANLGYPNPTSKGRKYQGYQVTTDSPRFAFRTRCEASKDRSSKAQRILPRLIRPWVQFGVCRLLLGDLHILMNHDELKNEL